MNFKILTLFPELFPGPLGASITGAGLGKKLWSFEAINIRDYAKDERKTVDDTPYGGGAGMVLRADIIAEAIERNYPSPQPSPARGEGAGSELGLTPSPARGEGAGSELGLTPSPLAGEGWGEGYQLLAPKIIYLSPRGKIFNQKMARQLAQEKEIMILCGRYEGVDQRVLDEFAIEEISIGDYVLSGGEIAAYVFIDAILRNVPGVLGADESLLEESFSFEENSEFENLLEYPHFTRPPVWRGREVPPVLLSGHHKKINEWRKERAIEVTKKNRPDLWKKGG